MNRDITVVMNGRPGTIGRTVRLVLWHPVRIVPVSLLAVIAVSTALLMLPGVRAGPERAPFFTAMFTATSAISTTGLEINQTSEYWSAFGHVVIAALTQLGGYGVMTAAMLTTLLVARRLGLRNRLVVQAETTRMGIGNIRRVLVFIALVMLVSEVVIALILTTRLYLYYDYPLGQATWYGVFHAIQAFNNGGFTLFNGSMSGFVSDPWVSLSLAIGVIVGSLGFPVIFELVRSWRRPQRWSVLTRLTLWGSAALLAVGFLAVLYFERNNQVTLGGLDPQTKVLAAFVQSAFPRSGGFYTVDYGAMREETKFVITILMFIGGGSASPAGGIKVGTAFLLAFVVWAELRGEPEVVIARRRIASVAQRQALTITLLSLALVTATTLTLVGETRGLRVYDLLFEAVSALSTAGLSVGLTPDLPLPAQATLMVLMFIGRLGTIIAASALALNTRPRRYRYPEEQPIVG